MNFQCARCGHPLFLPTSLARIDCAGCGMNYYGNTSRLSYEPHDQLLERFGERYLRNKVLNNNADLVYGKVAGGSLSTADRDDVQAFVRFVDAYAVHGVVLDIGCGPLPLPEYLRNLKASGADIVGLDPLDSNDFQGFRITGCSELMPLPAGSVDTAIFATSLDHVVDLTTTIAETRRVVRTGGRVIVWMSDQYRPWWRRILGFTKARLKACFSSYPGHRYRIYPHGVVLYVPPWAVDPFHSYHESPMDLSRDMRRGGFVQTALDYRAKDEVFLCFEAV
jgi:SAM-dependent methyltransferase